MDDGISIINSDNNIIHNNSFNSNGFVGVFIISSYNNTIKNNIISNNNHSIRLRWGGCYHNLIYHNNFINNTNQAYDDNGKHNFWNASYPTGGNYWSDYNGIDIYSGPNQDLPGSDGFGDTPYTNIIGETGAQDYYPVMEPWENSTSIYYDIDDWPMFGHDPQHTGYIDSDAPNTNKILWERDFPQINEATSSPSISGDRVYVTIRNETGSHLLALNKWTGETEWSIGMGEGALSRPSIIGDYIFLNMRINQGIDWGDWQNRWTETLCINKNSQEIVWSSVLNYTSPTNLPPMVTAENDRVYRVANIIMNPNLTDIDYVTIESLDSTDGGVIWSRNITTDEYSVSHPLITVGDEVVLFSGENGIYALDKFDGEIRWQFDTSVIRATSVIYKGRVYFGANSYVYSLYLENGTLIWKKYLDGGDFTTPAVFNDKLFIGFQPGGEGCIASMDAINGNLLWVSPTFPDSVTNTPAVADGKVFTSFASKVYVFDENTGQILWTDDVSGGGFYIWPHNEGPAISDGILYITIGFGALYAFGPKVPIPDLSISSKDITVSSEDIYQWDIIETTAAVHNSGKLDATGTVSFYLDEVDPDNLFYREYEVFVPAGGSTDVRTDLEADFTGDHTIIVKITDSDPAEENLANNEASKGITVNPEELPKLKVMASTDKQVYWKEADDHAVVIIKVSYHGELISGCVIDTYVIDPLEQRTFVSVEETRPGIYTGIYQFTNSSHLGAYIMDVTAKKDGYADGNNFNRKDKFFLTDGSRPRVENVGVSLSIINQGDLITITPLYQTLIL